MVCYSLSFSGPNSETTATLIVSLEAIGIVISLDDAEEIAFELPDSEIDTVSVVGMVYHASSLERGEVMMYQFDRELFASAGASFSAMGHEALVDQIDERLILP